MHSSSNVPVTRHRVRGSARGMGVDWSTVAEKAFAPRSSAAAPASVNVKKLFRSWDEDGDGMLSVLEICWGLRRMGVAAAAARSGEQMLPSIMFARIIKHLEVLTMEDKNPDWQFLDAEAFRELLFTAVPAEAVDGAVFLAKYNDLGLLDTILPEDSLERSPRVETSTKSRKKKKKKKGNKKTKKAQGTKSRLVRVFESWDTDGDGTLSVQEIKDAVALEGGGQENEEASEESRVSLLKPAEMGAVKKYIADLEVSGETLGWLYLDPAEFQEIVWG